MSFRHAIGPHMAAALYQVLEQLADQIEARHVPSRDGLTLLVAIDAKLLHDARRHMAAVTSEQLGRGDA